MIHRAPMPIVVGSPRSGTTLLRLMLDAHPDLAIPPETGFLVPCTEHASQGPVALEDFFRIVTGYPPETPGWSDFQIPAESFLARLRSIDSFTIPDGIRAFYELYAARFGKPRWGDKTPLYCLHVASIEALLPEAHFIHIVRDGRDVALSMRQVWFAPGQDIETLAAYWRNCVTSGRQQGAACGHYLEVRYDRLIENTREVLSEICGFVDLEFDERMLRYHESAPERLREHLGRFRHDGSVAVTHEQRLDQQRRTSLPPDRSRVSVWKEHMPREEQVRFDAIAGDTLREFGFA